MRFSPQQEKTAWLFEFQCWTGCPYLPSAVHIPKCFSRQIMKAMIRLIKQTRLKSDIKCHISSDFFPRSEVLLGASKEAKNLSNCAVEKQLIRCKETVFCCFIHGECYAKYTAVVRNWPRIPLMPDPLQTSEARLHVAPPFLALCPLQSYAPYSPSCVVTNSRQGWALFLSCPQLHGQLESWGKNSSPWGLKKTEVFQLRQKPPLSHPMWPWLSFFSAKLHLIWGRNIRATDKQGCIFDYDLWAVLNSY